jgi:NitT/TauT family transport system permease protein
MSDTLQPRLASRRPLRRSRRGATGTRTLTVLLPLASAAALVGLWALWVHAGDVSPQILPSPEKVLSAMASRSELLLPEALSTLKLILQSYALAVSLGVICAIAIVAVRPLELTLYPILVGSQVVPKIAIAPIIFVWFGLGTTSRLIVVVLLAFFPVVIAAVVGLRSAEQNRIYLARSLGANGWQIFTRIRIPGALPDLFAGLKLAAARTVGGAIIAEFLTPGDGLGRAIAFATYELRPDIALAGIGYLVVIGTAFFFVMTAAERLALPWHVSTRTGAAGR